jgi:cytochrome c peroxidase
MRKYIFISILIFSSLTSWVLIEEVNFFVPENWPKPVYNFKENKLTKEKIELGRVLFYDPILSKNNKISCASCHSSFGAFAHVDHALSHGIYDSIGTRNVPSLMNLAWQPAFRWDGGIENLDEFSVMPITHPKEMGEQMSSVVSKLNQSAFYKSLFFQSYQDSIISKEKLLKSLSQFLLTLVSYNSKYDSVMRKQVSFTKQESNGYQIFKANCNVCHQEPLFTNFSYQNNGLPIDFSLNDYGRYAVTQNHSDSFLFKVPTLRNIEYSFPYMHDGRFKKLSEVIKHYTSGIISTPTLSSSLKNKISLNTNDKIDLISFLLTLSDRTFVFNPDFQFPKQLLAN